jgi:hypothetical protein
VLTGWAAGRARLGIEVMMSIQLQPRSGQGVSYAMEGEALVRARLRLQGIEVTEAGRLARGHRAETSQAVDASQPREIARVYAAEIGNRCVAWLRDDLPDATAAKLSGLAAGRLFAEHQTVKAALADDAPCETLWLGTSYVIRDVPRGSDEAAVVRLGAEHQGAIDVSSLDVPDVSRRTLAVIDQGRVVSFCTSVREYEHAAEAWVITAARYRHRGLAQAVVRAWVRSVLSDGKTAFYSHERGDAAAQMLAATLRLMPTFSDVAYL